MYLEIGRCYRTAKGEKAYITHCIYDLLGVPTYFHGYRFVQSRELTHVGDWWYPGGGNINAEDSLISEWGESPPDRCEHEWVSVEGFSSVYTDCRVCGCRKEDTISKGVIE